METILGSVSPFLDHLFQQLAADGIDVSSYELDHLCYRVDTLERYQKLKTELCAIGSLLTTSMIAGRPISTFKLFQPLQYQERRIWCVELPAPKAGSPYPEGFEHIEFVIDQTFDIFMARYPQLTFNTKGMNKAVNPEISRKYGTMAVKFHHHPIEYVIKYLDE